MTTPRDPIEAPATLRGKHLLSVLPDLIRGPWTPFREGQWTGTIAAIEAAARDEGRREAVRLIEALEQAAETFDVIADMTEMGGDIPTEATIGANRARAALARHGRSSDPEPAPRHMHGWGEICDSECSAWRGPVPALQTTGEPPSAVECCDMRHIHEAAEATGEGERHE